ncbi:MAG: BTAD domain-containing putative transcriptional regulator [Rhodococcus sp. (in: high G+C Gram-positive bacteria)]
MPSVTARTPRSSRPCERVPANTELTEALMRAYLASGDRSSAEQVYDSHVNALDRLDLDEVVRAVLLEIGG